MGHKADELNNEKMNKQKRNKSDGVDNAIVKKDYNCYQLKIFKKKILAKQRRQKKNKWK